MFLLQFLYKLEEFFPFFFEEMHSDAAQFNVIGDFAIGFFGFPGDEVFCLGDGAGGGFVIFVAHGILLKMILSILSIWALNALMKCKM